MCRFSSLAVYRVDSNKLSGGPFSTAALKVCDSTQELEQLEEVTKASGDAKMTWACHFYSAAKEPGFTRQESTNPIDVVEFIRI